MNHRDPTNLTFDGQNMVQKGRSPKRLKDLWRTESKACKLKWDLNVGSQSHMESSNPSGYSNSWLVISWKIPAINGWYLGVPLWLRNPPYGKFIGNLTFDPFPYQICHYIKLTVSWNSWAKVTSVNVTTSLKVRTEVSRCRCFFWRRLLRSSPSVVLPGRAGVNPWGLTNYDPRRWVI